MFTVLAAILLFPVVASLSQSPEHTSTIVKLAVIEYLTFAVGISIITVLAWDKTVSGFGCHITIFDIDRSVSRVRTASSSSRWTKTPDLRLEFRSSGT